MWVMNKTVKRENNHAAKLTDLRNAIVTVSLLETDPALVYELHVKLVVKINIILQMELQSSILPCCMTEL